MWDKISQWWRRRQRAKEQLRDALLSVENAELKHENGLLRQQVALLEHENQHLHGVIERDRQRVEAESAEFVFRKESAMVTRKSEDYSE